MRSVRGTKLWSVPVADLCRAAYAQITCVLDVRGAIEFIALWFLREARLSRFPTTFAVFATTTLEQLQIGRA
jgi:hypothetical protein